MGRARGKLEVVLGLVVVVREFDGCWEWVGRVARDGYGKLWWEDKNRQAHRVVYELLRGAIPPGLESHHLCNNRRCVNPDHLEPLTKAEHARRHLGRRGDNRAHALRTLPAPSADYWRLRALFRIRAAR